MDKKRLKGDELRMFSSLKRLHVEERVNLFYEIKLKPMEMRIRRSLNLLLSLFHRLY